MKNETEQDLVRRFRDGDAAERAVVFEEIHRRLGRGLELLCRRMVGHRVDVEDVLQDVFLAMHRGLPRFRGEAKLSTWAYRIAVSLALHQRARRSNEQPLDFEPESAQDDPLRAQELAQALDRAVASLRPEYRSAFSLCCVDELSQKDVAHILGIPEGTLWTHLHRARKALAAKMAAWH